MKKVFLALAIIASVACFSSCKKTCSCTVTVLGVSTTIDDIDLNEAKENNSNIKNCKDLGTSGLTFSGVKLAEADCK